ncbi:MAG: DNA-binding protein [Candidatus Competibacteraceae bacterium]|nr:DNA-binding protein [Candidatus Competibacteraceae bacterium]
MANLIVRNLDDEIVQALKERAARHRQSAEAEHRAILKQILLKPQRQSFAQVLASIPDVGLDADFARPQDETAPHVFD